MPPADHSLPSPAPDRLARLLAAVNVPARKKQVAGLESLVKATYRSPAAMRAFDALAAGPGGNRLAMEFAARMPVPVPNGILLLGAPHLSDRTVPLPLRLAAAGKFVASLPDTPEAVGPILRSLTAGLSETRALERLIQLQSRVAKCDSLDAAVRERERLVRVACPKCRRRFHRPELAKHLWTSHRILFHHGRAQAAGPFVEEAVGKAVETRQAEGLDRVYLWAGQLYDGVDPGQVHQAILSRVGATPEDLEPLVRAAAEQKAGVCPGCYSAVRVPTPPAPPPLVLADGRLTGDGYTVEVAETARGRWVRVVGPGGGVLADGPDPGPRLSPRWLAVWAALPVAVLAGLAAAFAPTAKPLGPAAFGLAAAGLIYFAVRLARPALAELSDRAVDAAWRELAPRVGRSVSAARFLTRLCRVSLGRGTTEERTDSVWELAGHAAVLADKGGAYVPLFAAARVLQAFDASRIGLDWPTELVKVFEPVLKGEEPVGVADAAADVLLTADVFGDPEAARLRVLVAAAGFEAGWTPADFAALAPADPHLTRLLALGDDWLRLLYSAWRMRKSRPWEQHVGSAETAIDFARTSPVAGGRALAAVPDAVLVGRFDGAADAELGAVLIGRKGVTVAGVTVADPDAPVRIEAGRGVGGVLVFGSNRLALDRKLPDRVAATLRNWLWFRAARLVPAAEAADARGVPERVRQLVAAAAADCPVCGTRAVYQIGELGRPVTR